MRLFLGQTAVDIGSDEVLLLETNIDDATVNKLVLPSNACGMLGRSTFIPALIAMKKDRPGVLLSVLCPPAYGQRLEDLIFMHTGSLGIRRQLMARRKLHREIIRVETSLG